MTNFVSLEMGHLLLQEERFVMLVSRSFFFSKRKNATLIIIVAFTDIRNGTMSTVFTHWKSLFRGETEHINVAFVQ